MPEQSPTIDCGHCGTPVKRSVRTCLCFGVQN